MALNKERLGLAAIIALTAMPLARWLMLMPLGARFGSFGAAFTSFGQAAALAGMALFASVIVLSARLMFLEDYFGGLNRMYSAHHRLGAVSFILLLFHPLLLAVSYAATSLRSAALFLLPSGYWPYATGMIALALMAALIILTFFVKLGYGTWKVSHKFLGVAFLFGAWHTLIISSDVSRDPLLRTYYIAITILGAIAFLYWTVFHRLLAQRAEYTVRKVTRLNDRILEIELEPNGPPISFSAGQFVFTAFRQQGITRESHPFSITSPPSEAQLKIAVKSLGDYTRTLDRLRPGTPAEVEGPYGRFYPENLLEKPQVWIAGGIGITPFVSLARSLLRRNGPTGKIDLYYCAANAGESVLTGELEELARHNKNFRLIPFCSDVRGRLYASSVEETSGSLQDKEIFICGPPAMMSGLEAQFLNMKVPRAQIHTEEFGFKL